MTYRRYSHVHNLYCVTDTFEKKVSRAFLASNFLQTAEFATISYSQGHAKGCVLEGLNYIGEKWLAAIMWKNQAALQPSLYTV
jgi:hypothetical protein